MHQIENYINKGRYSKVFEGKYNDQTVAIKQLIFPENITRKERFINECNITESLNHPNIIKYVGKNDIFLYVELMDCDLLCAMKMSDINIEKCMLDIANGLHYLHNLEKPVIHRDIKAENMLIKHTNTGMRTVIADFGFSVVCDSSKKVECDMRTGTPIYMAYEIIVPKQSIYSPASDMWAFGILCWFLITKKSIDCAYQGIGNIQEYKQCIENGRRLNFNNIVGDPNLFAIVQLTWEQNMNIRPSAEDFIDYLSKGTIYKTMADIDAWNMKGKDTLSDYMDLMHNL